MQINKTKTITKNLINIKNIKNKTTIKKSKPIQLSNNVTINSPTMQRGARIVGLRQQAQQSVTNCLSLCAAIKERHHKTESRNNNSKNRRSFAEKWMSWKK